LTIARGLKSMEGFILSGNMCMRKLARRLGFKVSASGEAPGVVRVWLGSGPTPASRRRQYRWGAGL
jgi:hypothetical protein